MLRLFFLGLLGIGCFLFGLNRYYTSRLKSQEKTLRYLTDENAFLKEVGFDTLLTYEIRRIDEELILSNDRILSDASISRIITLSNVLFEDKDEINGNSERHFSSERGRLLLLLVSMKMNAGSFQQIISRANFSYSMLKGADLEGAVLDGIMLNGSDLSGANLKNASMKGGKLTMVNLFASRMDSIDVRQAEINQSNLSWVYANDSDFAGANLSGSLLTSAQLRRSSFQKADMEWADLSHACLHNADFMGAGLFRAIFRKAIMPGVTLNKANLSYANLIEASIEDASMDSVELVNAVVVDSNWIRNLERWNIQQAIDINEKYKLVNARVKNSALFSFKYKNQNE